MHPVHAGIRLTTDRAVAKLTDDETTSLLNVADSLTEGAWRAYQRATENCGEVVTKNSRPIAWFGDLVAYAASPTRILTVGLNPSQIEFPALDHDCRFPLASGAEASSTAYRKSLNAYFRTDPYWPWFCTFCTMLEGMNASFDGRYGPNTAVHTDLCSPVATSPTWSKLQKMDPDACTFLKGDGVPLWNDLVRQLKPRVVLISVAEEHLDKIDFFSADLKWEELYAIAQPAGRYIVRTRRYTVEGKPVLFVWGKANVKPFQGITYEARRDLGARVLAHLKGIAPVA
jgi:hypothetical protein